MRKVLNKILETYVSINDWYLDFFFRDHLYTTAILMGIGLAALSDNWEDILKHLLSKRSKT